MKKFLKYAVLAVGVVVVGLVLTVVGLSLRTYDRPLPDLKASSDPAVIARGKYLAYGPAHCAECHGDVAAQAAGLPADAIPLSGGLEFQMPIGVIRTANITSDKETGIGNLSDAELARSLRYGVNRHGKALMPFMPFANLSDEDLTALLSFLRAQPAVSRPVRTQELNLAGHAVMALILEPEGPTGTPLPSVKPEPTADYGRYLVHNVGNCVGCHTERSMATGEAIGPVLAGGLEMESHLMPELKFVTPNLTPHPETGRLSSWSEETFVARFKMGRGAEGSPMPWRAFGTMTEDDLRAIYRYLSSLPPVNRDTGPSVRAPEVAKASN